MAFYTLSQLVAGLGATSTDYAVQHKEVMDVMIYADATLTNSNNKKDVFDSLVLLDQQWDTSLKNKGLPYLLGRVQVYKDMIKGFSGVEMESAAIKSEIKSFMWGNPLAAVGAGIGYNIRWLGAAAAKSLEQALQNALKSANPFIDPLTGKESNLWKNIKWPLILGGGAIALMVIVTYALPLLKIKKGGKK